MIACLNPQSKTFIPGYVELKALNMSSRAAVINFGDIALTREKYFDVSRYPSWAHRRNEVLISWIWRDFLSYSFLDLFQSGTALCVFKEQCEVMIKFSGARLRRIEEVKKLVAGAIWIRKKAQSPSGAIKKRNKRKVIDWDNRTLGFLLHTKADDGGEKIRDDGASFFSSASWILLIIFFSSDAWNSSAHVWELQITFLARSSRSREGAREKLRSLI